MRAAFFRRTALTLAFALVCTLAAPCGAVFDAPEADTQAEPEIPFVRMDGAESSETSAPDVSADDEGADSGGETDESESSAALDSAAPTDEVSPPAAETPDEKEAPDESGSQGEGEASVPPLEPLPETGATAEPEPSDSDETPDGSEEPNEPDISEEIDDPEIPFEPEETAEAQPDEQPVIQVVVPKNAHIFINPYGMPVADDETKSTEQIVSPPQQITNYSDVPVTVWASAAGAIAEESSAVYVAEPPEKEGPDKEVFLYAEFQSEEDEWQGVYAGAENQILITERPTEPQPVLELAEDGEPGSVGLFRLFGELTTYPDEPWCENDALEVVLTFTFLPEGGAPEEEPSGDWDDESDGNAAPASEDTAPADEDAASAIPDAAEPAYDAYDVPTESAPETENEIPFAPLEGEAIPFAPMGEEIPFAPPDASDAGAIPFDPDAA